VLAQLARKPWMHIRRVDANKGFAISLGVFDPSNSENYPIACLDQGGQLLRWETLLHGGDHVSGC